MYNIKITLPSQKDNITFDNFYDMSNQKLKNYRFHINKDIEQADFWFVFEDLKLNTEFCKVPKNNVIYLNNETSYKRLFFPAIHEQIFRTVSRSTVLLLKPSSKDKNNIPFLPWMIHANHGSTIYDKSSYNFKYFQELKQLKKTKKISVICSNKVHTENHNLRVEFLKKLKLHFGDQLDWYGNGVNEIKHKYEGIFDYKYHIVLENDSRKNLISEKLFDSMLGLSLPIYYGAPNIFEYFDKNSLHTIDINDIDSSIETIENILKNDNYEEHLDNLIESKDKILKEFNFLNRIIKIIETNKDIKLNNQNLYIHLTGVNIEKISL